MGVIGNSYATVVTWTDLSDYEKLHLEFSGLQGTSNTILYLQLSNDNGASWITNNVSRGDFAWQGLAARPTDDTAPDGLFRLTSFGMNPNAFRGSATLTEFNKVAPTLINGDTLYDRFASDFRKELSYGYHSVAVALNALRFATNGIFTRGKATLMGIRG